jgi:hypothetical protein
MSIENFFVARLKRLLKTFLYQVMNELLTSEFKDLVGRFSAAYEGIRLNTGMEAKSDDGS